MKSVIIAKNGKGDLPLEITVTADSGVARIDIKGNISSWSKASANDVEEVIKDFKAKNITTAEIYINSAGGSCLEANEILNLIKDNFTKVSITVGALAASAATYFLTQFYSRAKKNSLFMIHKPTAWADGNEDSIASTLKVLKDFTNQYKAAYAGKTGKTEEYIESLWAKGDYWMTAQEAKKFGLIDAIIDEEAITDKDTTALLVASGYPPAVKNIKTKKPKVLEMDKEKLIALYGLGADASDEEILNAARATKVDAIKYQELMARSAEDEKAKEQAKIGDLVDAAIKDKKIPADQKGRYIKLATADFESTKAILAAMTPTMPVSAQIETGTTKGGDDRRKWTYADYAEKDPKAFEALGEDEQRALIDAHYDKLSKTN